MNRNLLPRLHADFVAVELSDTFQTLAQRLEAMKHFKQPTSRQMFLTGCAIALLGTIAIVPWRVVAQEAKGDAPAAALVESAGASAQKAPRAKRPTASQPATSAEDWEKQWGNLKGRFVYGGKPPKPAKIEVPNDPDLQWLQKENLVDESLIVADDGGLANVAIWVNDDDVRMHPGEDNETAQRTAVMEIHGGRFEPRITPLYKPQNHTFKNFDPIAYDVTIAYNTNQPRGFTLNQEGKYMFGHLQCSEVLPVVVSAKSASLNSHSPKGYLVVQEHPYIAVTNKDGRFEIKNLPTGKRLQFQIWHERAEDLGYVMTDGADAETGKQGRIAWAMPRGRFEFTLQPGENSLGELTLEPKQFEKQEAQPTFDQSKSATEGVEAVPSVRPTATTFASDQIETLTPARDGWVPNNSTKPTVANQKSAVQPIAPKSMNEKLVGTWRGGSTNTIVHFNADGTYEEPMGTLVQSSDAVQSGVRGTWGMKVASDKLWLYISPSTHGGIIRGLPRLPNQPTEIAPLSQWTFQVLHVDDKFLRLSPAGDGSGIFFRRTEAGDNKFKVDPSLPADVCQLAELALLSPDEAAALAADKVDYFKKWKVEEQQLKQLLRLAAARRGQIDFAELFELDKDEITAYVPLYEMTKGNFQTVRALIDQGQLNDIEERAAKKIDKLATEMLNTMAMLNTAIVESDGKAIPAAPLSPSIGPKVRAVAKLRFGIVDFINYLSSFMHPRNVAPAQPYESP